MRTHDDVVTSILDKRGERINGFDVPLVLNAQVLVKLKRIDFRRHTLDFKLQGVAVIIRRTVVVLRNARGQGLKPVHVRRQATNAEAIIPWGGAPSDTGVLIAEPGARSEVPIDIDSLKGRIAGGGEDKDTTLSRTVEKSVAVHVINFRTDLEALVYDVPMHPKTLHLARVSGRGCKGVSCKLIIDISDESAYVPK